MDGNYEPGAFHNPNTGGQAGNMIKDGGWGGPGLYLPGDGRVQIRLQKSSTAYSTTEWPSDGRMGTLINASGAWQEPTSEDPNDYEIHITRFNGDYGVDGPYLFNTNGHDWWHVKGINGALFQVAVKLESGSSNNWFEKCTWYPMGVGALFFSSTPNNKFTRCMFLGPDTRHISWREHKGGGQYWNPHVRTAGIFGRQKSATTGAGTLLEHCTFFGWFDVIIDMDGMDSTIVLDHCAVLNTNDDGIMQNSTNKDWAFDAYYSFFGGGPPWSGNGNNGAGSRDNFWHHCVIDNRIPMLWSVPAQDEHKQGVHVNTTFPTHGAGATGPVQIRKLWNCTFLVSPDPAQGGIPVSLGPSNPGHNVPSGRAHEVYNNIVAMIDNKRYPHKSAAHETDGVACRISVDRSTAGTHRYNYNCYYRDVPSPNRGLVMEAQTSRNQNKEDFANLTAFRSSGKKTTSESMYVSVAGAFSGSNGTDGHEANGVEVNPGFVDLANRDYRPTHSSVTSGHLDVSTSGWPGATDAHSWKGAVDPNGNGSEIGPQPE